MVSFADATAVQALDSHTYHCNFRDEWSIGNACNQPHTITLHLSFLRRTSIGSATFSIRDVKLGRRTSTVHVSLRQNDGTEPSVVGYLTQSNLKTEEGISLPTHWSLHPSPLPLLSTAALQDNTDPNWARAHRPSTFRKAAARTQWYLPRHGRQPAPATADEWICLADGGRFTQTSLGFVVDQFPQIVEMYPLDEQQFTAGNGDGDGREEKTVKRTTTTKWYPTVLLNLDVKKALPEQGVEWLFVRVRAKRIENGRMDLEVVVLDEVEELVAVSNHVCLILGAERNMERSGTSKI
ncbi:MAG: hypothetical protein Q9204_002284 [Flavoplaca sp. TL-2023a]